jgi:Na+/H+-dicarboxylate symporter
MNHSKNLSRNILLSLVLGAMVGIFLPSLAPFVSWMGLVFKLSLKMIVMPIVLTSILCGLESIGCLGNLRGLAKKAGSYYLLTTTIAIGLGLFLVTTLKPGVRPPSDQLTSIFSHIQAASIEEANHSIKSAVAGLPVMSVTGFKDEYERTLGVLATESADVTQFKDRALINLSALELRSMMNSQATIAPHKPFSLQKLVESQLTNALKNPFEALAKQQVLAVIVFTILFGTAMTTIGPLGLKFFEINRAVNMATIKIIGVIMRYAPFGVFGLIVSVVSQTGPSVFRELSLYAACVVLGLAIHFFLCLPSLNYFFTGQKPLDFWAKIRPALAVAFSTSSSSAALPVTMQCLEDNLGVDTRVSRFVLPLGGTVNMDGTALYEAVAAVFIAQLYGISLDFSGQAIIALTAALGAIGTAGIPAAGTVTMTLVLSAAGLPLEGVGLLFALDRPLDMCRTVVNIAGDATGCNILNRQFLKEIRAVTA